jgi:hypothetical protein
VGALHAIPLLTDPGGPDADLLEEGIKAGHTSVREVSESGSVGLLRVSHSGTRPLLLVDGEQVLGAKQNRIFNASFLVPPGGVAEIPVSCVERGRWSYRTKDFHSSETTVTSHLRSSKLRRVTTSVLRRRGYCADQSAVWGDVDDYLERTHVTSVTGAFSDGYRSRSANAERQLSQLTPEPDQIGLAATHGNRLVTLDILGSTELYARAWRKLARGLCGEVYGEVQRTAPEQSRAMVDQLIRNLAGATPARVDAPGCGHTLHGNLPGAAYGAVVHDGAVYHAIVAGT